MDIFNTLADITRPEENTYTFKIYQDNELKKEFNGQKNDFEAFKWLLNNQGQSINHAIKYEGWKVEEINETTKESEFWKPYA
jgi:hypothetical protein